MHRICCRPTAILALAGLLLIVSSLSSAAGPASPDRAAAAGPTLQAPPRRGPPLSQAALFSRFAKENLAEEAIDLARLEAQTAPAVSMEAPLAALQANADYNRRPQNETSIAIKPGTSGPSATWIIGGNDYGIGLPIGGGVYTSGGVTYFPPFPLLFARGGSGSQILVEPTAVTGDPALAYGRTRAAPSVPPGLSVAYYASLAVSTNFCENGIIVARSFTDGASWNRVTMAAFAPPKGIGIVTYYDSAQNCSVFNDKEYIAVDNTGGPYDGRVYVTWTRFVFADGRYRESPILMAWSDDNAVTFSDPVVVSGSSATLCANQVNGPAGVCDEDQGSTPVVLPDGRVAIAFINGQGAGFSQGFRDQYLVTIYDPGTGALAGPFKAADLFTGVSDYPFNEDRRQTLCNSNFRQWGLGNLTVGKVGSATVLYLTYSDNKKHAGEFPFPTFVGNRASGYACPAGKVTDTDVYVLKSTDGGMTWTDITPADAQAAHDQWFPWVAADAAGRVSVVFYDRSGDPGNKLAHTTLVRSSNGGMTWAVTTVSDFASNFDNAFFGLGSFIGDYNGNAIDGAGVSHPVWTGVRPGKFDSDIFTTTVGP